MKLLLVLLATVFYSGVIHAQHDHSAHAKQARVSMGRGSVGPSSGELLNSTIELDDGHGAAFLYTDAKGITEQYINQGFAMLNLFQYADAFRSFTTALGLNSSSHMALIGRGLAARSLDPTNNGTYVAPTLDSLAKSASELSPEETAWANLLSALSQGTDLTGSSLNKFQAYEALRSIAPENLEVLSAANWLSGTYDVADLEAVLETTPEHAGALHYLLHLAESKNSHEEALEYAESLKDIATGSGHGQHMLGHVLPHFGRWAEAQEQFVIADKIHTDWAELNGVEPQEDWHYAHNLDLLAVTQVVLEDNTEALETFEKLASLSPAYLSDYINYASVSLPQGEDSYYEIKSIIDDATQSFQPTHPILFGSILYFQLLHTPSSESINNAINALQSGAPIREVNVFIFFFDALRAISTKNSSATADTINAMVTHYQTGFEKGGFDGWKQSVMEVKMISALAKSADLDEVTSALNDEIIDVYMSEK